MTQWEVVLTFGNYQSDHSNLHKSLLVLGLTWNTNVSSVYNLSSSLASLSFQCTVVAAEDTPAPSLSSMRILKCLMELLPGKITFAQNILWIEAYLLFLWRLGLGCWWQQSSSPFQCAGLCLLVLGIESEFDYIFSKITFWKFGRRAFLKENNFLRKN